MLRVKRDRDASLRHLGRRRHGTAIGRNVTKSAPERQAGDHATIGDALIFMAKGLLATLALAALLIVGAIWWFNKVGDLNSQINLLRRQNEAFRLQNEVFRLKVDEHEITIADLGSKLNLCLASATLPEGLALEQNAPNPFEAEHRRR